MDLWKLLEKQDIEGLNEAAITGRLDDHLYMYHMPYSYTAEQIRKLRTYLFHMPDKTPPRILMVTSALPSEGKTVIASNLAISIAKGEDQHVLLVECDLRKPSMYTLFKYPPSKGVAEILQGTANVAECLIKTPIDKLTILPAAKVTGQPLRTARVQKMGSSSRSLPSAIPTAFSSSTPRPSRPRSTPRSSRTR